MAQAARREGWLAMRGMKLSEEREVQGATAVEEARETYTRAADVSQRCRESRKKGRQREAR